MCGNLLKCEVLEAETVSFLLCKNLGLETRAAEYIAAYIKNEDDLIKFSYESVVKMADKIEEILLKQNVKSDVPIQQSLF